MEFLENQIKSKNEEISNKLVKKMKKKKLIEK